MATAALIDVAREFSTEEACLAYIESMRWPGGLACLKCGSVRVSKTVSTVKNRRTGKVSKARHLYDCLEPECRHQFSATTGTVFHDTHLPLPLWFLAIAIICDSKKGVSALQLQRQLGIGSYRTAWHLGHRIRKAMEQGGGLLMGTVEMDETFIGGKNASPSCSTCPPARGARNEGPAPGCLGGYRGRAVVGFTLGGCNPLVRDVVL